MPLLQQLAEVSPESRVIIPTAHGTIADAVDPEPLVREHAARALAQIGTRQGRRSPSTVPGSRDVRWSTPS